VILTATVFHEGRIIRCESREDADLIADLLNKRFILVSGPEYGPGGLDGGYPTVEDARRKAHELHGEKLYCAWYEVTDLHTMEMKETG